MTRKTVRLRVMFTTLVTVFALVTWLWSGAPAYAASWTVRDVSSAETLFSFDFVSPTTGWAVGGCETVMKTVDGGCTWVPSSGIGGSYVNSHLLSVDFVDSNTGWAVGGPDWGGPSAPSSKIVRTVDGGVSWLRVTSPFVGHLQSVSFLSASVGWVTGYNGTIGKTTDGGVTWTRQETGTTDTLYAATFLDGNTGWAVGSSGAILKTTDGGVTWTRQLSGTSAALHSVDFVDENSGYAVGWGSALDGVMLRTTDGGVTWSRIDCGAGEALQGVDFLDASTGWAIGSRCIYLTTDGGVTWDGLSSDHEWRDVLFLDASTGWVLGSRVLGGQCVGTYSEGNATPVLASIGDKTVNELATLSFTCTATDPDMPAQTLTFSLIDAPAGAIIDPSTGVFSWMPTEAQGPGNYDVIVRVSDGVATDQETITVVVADVNTAPVLAPIYNKSVSELEALAFTAVATDIDVPMNALSYELLGAPAGAMFDPSTGVFSWTPTEAQGPGRYEITVRVSDGVATDQETITVVVAEVNTPPVLAHIGDKTASELATLSFTCTATDPDIPAQTLTFSLNDSGPAGAIIDEATGVFSWTPTDADGPRRYDVTLVVRDAYGGTDSETVTIMVNARSVAAPDTYSTPSNIALSVRTPGVLANDTDADGDELTAVKKSDPAHGIVTLSADGSFTYTPAADFTGTDTFTYAANDGAVDSNTVTVTITVTPQATIEDNAAGVTFDRFVPSTGAAYSGGTYIYGRWTGTRIESRFTGTKIAWYGPKQPVYGKADVYIDGVYKATVDCYAPSGSATVSTKLWESATLGAGTHTLSIRLTGAKNGSSGGYIVVVDKFVVSGTGAGNPQTRANESAGTFTGAWIPTASTTYTGGTYRYSRWAGAKISYTFTGTKIAWVGPRCWNYGRADVYIDGVKKATVSQYGVLGWRYRVWESATLAAGQHTIEIRVLGTKEAASTNTIIVVDGFDVKP